MQRQGFAYAGFRAKRVAFLIDSIRAAMIFAPLLIAY